MDFTQEQKDEIRASYRDAKNPEKQRKNRLNFYHTILKQRHMLNLQRKVTRTTIKVPHRMSHTIH